MCKILIGSEAKRRLLNLDIIPNDLDYIVDNNSHLKSTKEIEYFKVDVETFKFLKDRLKLNEINFHYTLTFSHLFWNNKQWWKHFKSVGEYLEHGSKLDEEMFSFMYKFWTNYHGDKSHIKVEGYANEFFKPTIDRLYDHDELHDMIKIDDLPAYKHILTNEDDIKCSYDKFIELDKRTQALCLLEEAMVISIERRLALPNGIKHVVINLSKGKFSKRFLELMIDILYFKEYNDIVQELNKKRRKL